jgi:predicted dithiol-disulfide oxidoreductase (DUF899 family)
MSDGSVNLGRIVFRDEWLAARKAVPVKEKEFSRAYDALNAERRRLPMLAPLGRQENWEDAAPGQPRCLEMWIRHHDKYGEVPGGSNSCCSSM